MLGPPFQWAWLICSAGPWSWWTSGGAGLARPPCEAVARAQGALRGSPLLGLEGGRDGADQPGVHGEAVRGSRLVHPGLESVGQPQRRARRAGVVEIGDGGGTFVGVRVGVGLRDDELDLTAAEPQVDGTGSEVTGDLA